jgi:hypothetical protein
MITMPELYLVWSNEHGRWWRPGHQGYTGIIALAGRYRRKEAMEICDSANFAIPKGREPNEVMVLAPECITTPEA